MSGKINSSRLYSAWMVVLIGFKLTAASGCGLWAADADREVYRLIEQRQMAALGTTSEARVEDPTGEPRRGDLYSFVPNPISPDVPEEFTGSPAEAREGLDEPPRSTEVPELLVEGTENESADPEKITGPPAEASADAALEEEMFFGEPMTLSEVFAYSIRNARGYQDAKEDLYLQALALTLERHLWTPRFMSNLRANYTEFPQDSDPDRALEAVADVAVEQRLPFGGEVTAQWIGTMMRDLENHVTNSESGTAILRANVPLLRGAGRVAYESRYQAERNLVYAVRDYELFRREFLTTIAAAYFELLSQKSSINNAILSRESFRENSERADALAQAERLVRLDSDRARVEYLQAKNDVSNSREAYRSALDEFKILIGMPIVETFDVVDKDLDLADPMVTEELAIETALRQRLDLLNSLDRVDDARRDVAIAENNLLPDLNLTGSVAYDSNPDHLSSVHFREDLETWNAGAEVEIPLDRKAERNAYRSSLISLRRAERNYDLGSDRVRFEVRRAMRVIKQAKYTLDIQEQNIKINEVRQEQAEIEFELGKISNRDLVEANNDLRDARDNYANAQSGLRRAILDFRLATGTLRVTDEGHWVD